MRIFGIIVAIGALLVMIGGLVGTVLMYDGASGGWTCRNALSCPGKMEEAQKAYDAAKGSSKEAEAQKALDTANKSCSSFVTACGEAQDFYRSRTMIYGGVAFVGFIGFLFGVILIIVGRNKKAA